MNEMYLVYEYTRDSKPHCHGAFKSEKAAYDYIPKAIEETKAAYKKSLGKFATINTYDNMIRVIMSYGKAEGPYTHIVVRFGVEKVNVMD